MASEKQLHTTLDRLPYGNEQEKITLKVSNKLPQGVKSRELYKDIIQIAWPSFVELLLTQLASMVDLMMAGSIGGKSHPEIGTDAVLGTLFAKPLVVFMGANDATVTKLATNYLQIQMIGFITLALTSTITAALRAVGDSKTCGSSTLSKWKMEIN